MAVNQSMEKNKHLKISSGYTYVNTAEGLERLTETLSGAVRVGVDTEADSMHHYFEKVCLIQISFSGTNAIIDPLVGLPLEDFFEVLAQKELILHGADYDLRMLKKSFGFRPKAPIFDTMLAAQVLGYEKIGLAALAEKFFGVVLPKTGQKSDWSRRPLSTGLLNYASDDTKYLESIADALSEHLEQVKRTRWHRECCDRVVALTGLPDKVETKEAWRIKGSSRLAPTVLVFVRELWKWRDAQARQKDRPPFMILQNEDLIALAEWRSKNPQAPLEQGPPFLKRFEGEIRALVEQALRVAASLPSSEWPEPPKKPVWPELPPGHEKLEPLMAACKMLAEELKIDAGFLASRATLTAVILHQPRTIEGVMEAAGMMQWQAELMLPKIKSLLGER